MKNKGTKEGTEQEVAFVKTLNKKEDLSYWKTLSLSSKNHFAIRVKTKKYGKLNNQKVFPKADVFIAYGDIPIEYLKDKEYFLDEDDVKTFDLKAVSKSGISIKRVDSKQYQIIKMSPTIFKKIFGSNLLASGASIYCTKEDEFEKNPDLLDGWGVTEKEFLLYFNKMLNINITSVSDSSNKKDLLSIKKNSNKKIAELIYSDSNISDFIFFGIGNFEEPFTAYWLYEHGEFKANYIIPFSVTTGSGRSKGIYTIVLKPK